VRPEWLTGSPHVLQQYALATDEQTQGNRHCVKPPLCGGGLIILIIENWLETRILKHPNRINNYSQSHSITFYAFVRQRRVTKRSTQYAMAIVFCDIHVCPPPASIPCAIWMQQLCAYETLLWWVQCTSSMNHINRQIWQRYGIANSKHTKRCPVFTVDGITISCWTAIQIIQ